MKLTKFVVTICLYFYPVYSTNSSIKLIQVLFRHGERTPTSSYKNDPYKDFDWPQGLGQLINKGMYNMYALGLNLREIYKDAIPEYYFPKEVGVLSSSTDRCKASVQLVLAGLFPPVGEQIWNSELLWQPIPVNYIPRELDNVLVMKKPCPKYDVAFKEAFESARVTKLNEKYQSLMQELAKHSGETITDIRDVERIVNILENEEINGLELPEWTSDMYPEPMKTIYAETLDAFAETLFMQRVMGGVFVKEVLNNMLKKSQEESDKVLNLYSAHDVTIIHVMKALGYVKLIKPDFASSLSFELHYNNHEYSVQVLYKEHPNATAISVLPQICKEQCSLAEFSNALRPVIPMKWEQECSVDSS